MTCQNCQKEIAAGSNFCYNCGAKQPEVAAQPNPPAYSYAPQRRLVRSINDRKVGGVCAGVADYFDFDPSIVRIIWVLTVILPLPGPTLLIYFIMWVALPEGMTRPYPYSATSSV